ncbi:hypothetical protein KKF32_03730 [Patescibacteria group bacterium]|nr:hypothetical protein [Patescibacteria group bacterium]
MKVIGLSSDILYKTVPPTSKKIFKIFRKINCRAVEIHCPASELSSLERIDPADLQGFTHVSLHLPSRGIIYDNNSKTKRILELIQRTKEKLNFKWVIVHPHKVKNWNIFKNCSFTVAVENMDYKRNFGKNVEDLKKIFKNTFLKFILDINHCFTNDRSLKLVDDLYKNFKDKLCEIHVSGFIKNHEPLHLTKQKKILQAIPDCTCPIIIESVCLNEDQLKKEFTYINNFFHAS